MKKKILVLGTCCALGLGVMTGCGEQSDNNKLASDIETEAITEEKTETVDNTITEQTELAEETTQETTQEYTLGDLSPTAEVLFGNYEQDNDTSNGSEPIEWILADNINGYVVLVSKYGLDVQPYNTDQTDITWENCSLRHWLNEDFYNAAFSDEEKKVMSPINLQNPSNEYYNVEGGNDTTDMVWILCHLDANKYIDICKESNGQVQTTPYVQSLEKINPYARPDSPTEMYGKEESYWLRTPGNKLSKAAVAYDDSNFGEVYSQVSEQKVIRPVIVLPEDNILVITKGMPQENVLAEDGQEKSQPMIGMTADEVLESTWGKPEKINTTETATHTNEQWVYSNNRYIYLEDGIVTTIQNSK